MSDLDALLAGIVADPSNALRWLVMADWLEENGFPERAELVRVHRELLRTCTATRETKARKQLHARMMELMRAGVQPCLPQRTIVLPGGVELRMSFIPPGSFLMGSPESEQGRQRDERLHRVMLTKAYWMGQTPVTQQQWHSVMGTDPSHFKGSELPVESVSWNDAQAFCSAVKVRTGLDARLPTEAEWEHAARSGTTTPFYWGAELDGTQANYNGEVPYGTPVQGCFRRATTPVGLYAAISPHPWCLADTLGNVWEWCLDWFGQYLGDDVVDPAVWKAGTCRVCRGGCWRDFGCHSGVARRGKPPANYEHFSGGFRIAASG